jgi:NTP pyrophosphatase (non-canonical NTP hydrolase)
MFSNKEVFMNWKIEAAEINEQWTSKANMGRAERIRFLALALAGEAGELANVVKKQWRDGPNWSAQQLSDNFTAQCKELADVVIYAYALANALKIDLDTVCEAKMTEVRERPFAKG